MRALPSLLRLGAALSFALGPAVPAAVPGRLNVVRDGAALVLSWTDGILQTAPTARGPWTVLSEAPAPLRITPQPAAAFYRVEHRYPLEITRAGTGSGSVKAVSGAIDCGGTCSAALSPGTTVRLQATPDTGATFAGWSGDCTGTGECVVTMDAARRVTATFDRAAALDPVVNGGFELGPSSGWVQQPGPAIYSADQLGVAPYSGRYAAYLGYDRDGRRLAGIGQRIALPATPPIYLNFALYLYSEELCDVPYYDAVTLYVNGTVVAQDDRVCRSSDGGAWARYAVDLSGVAGRTVDLVFEVSSADSLTSYILLDDIAVAREPWVR